uniref:Uncharacterized protein n=1 Tax=Heterorhabditis bacteriophora TaxID=37862 RepID=A0A1I7WDS5_HETBA
MTFEEHALFGGKSTLNWMKPLQSWKIKRNSSIEGTETLKRFEKRSLKFIIYNLLLLCNFNGEIARRGKKVIYLIFLKLFNNKMVYLNLHLTYSDETF